MRNVYITYYSSLSTLGIGTEESINNLLKEKVNIHIPAKEEKFNRPFFPIIREIDIKKDITRCAKFALKLLELSEEKWGPLAPIPLFYATSTGGIKETEEVYTNLILHNKKYPLAERQYFYDTYEAIQDRYKDKITDFYTFATACSSAGHAILHAFRFIKNGIIDKALVIGADSLSITTMIGFDSLKLVSLNRTKPLTNVRDGLSLGDGAGILLLESNPESEPIAEIVGVASNCDGFHLTSPNPEGTQQRKCIIDALKIANLNFSDIDYINAHGTGTFVNDEIELKVIKSIFLNPVPVSSLKAFIGHTLGSSAITELALALSMLQNNKIIQPDDMDEPMDINYIPKRTISKKVKYFLKNSFGFGGNNVSIIIKNLF